MTFNDNLLLIAIKAVLDAQAADVALAGLVIAKSAQPTNEGVELVTGAYVQKLFDTLSGQPQEDDIWDEENQVEIRTQSQLYFSTFQVSALTILRAGDLTQLTASDIANRLLMILRNPTSQQLFMEQGLGFVSSTEVRNPYFKDDHDRYEASPSFDFVLTYTQVFTKSVPYTDTVTLTLLPVQ